MKTNKKSSDDSASDDTEVEVKLECSEESSDEEVPRQPEFLALENQNVFHHSPLAPTVFQSTWPRYWLNSIETTFKLRKAEASSNSGFKEALKKLIEEVDKVR